MKVRSIALGFIAYMLYIWPALSFFQGRSTKGFDPDIATKTPKHDKLASKRSLWNFNSMINFGTERNSLHYLGYGCWCGLGGYGRPVDDVDRCCYAHDQCYNAIERSEMCGWPYSATTYITSYDTRSCTDCAPASSYSWWQGYGRCREELCKCDAAAVKCFARSKYHNHYRYYINTTRGYEIKTPEKNSLWGKTIGKRILQPRANALDVCTYSLE